MTVFEHGWNPALPSHSPGVQTYNQAFTKSFSLVKKALHRHLHAWSCRRVPRSWHLRVRHLTSLNPTRSLSSSSDELSLQLALVMSRFQSTLQNLVSAIRFVFTEVNIEAPGQGHPLGQRMGQRSLESQGHVGCYYTFDPHISVE